MGKVQELWGKDGTKMAGQECEQKDGTWSGGYTRVYAHEDEAAPYHMYPVAVGWPKLNYIPGR